MDMHPDYSGTLREFGCESCRFFGGWFGTLQSGTGLWRYDWLGECLNPKLTRVNAQPLKGCAFWDLTPDELP